MAAPRLRLRRGTTNPVELTDVGEIFESGSATQALVGEPLFVDTNGAVPTSEGNGGGDFYIADGGSSFVHIGGSSYTARVDSFLVDQTSAGAGAQLIFEEGGAIASAETITIKAPDDGNATNSYSMILPVGKPAVGGQYLLEYDQASEQLSFVTSGAGEQLLTEQVPDDTGAANDYFLTFVADNNPNGSAALESFYTEENVVLYPDKDGSGGGTISSLQITGEYVASTGYFSGTGSTDTASVTTNFATEPTASGNTKAVNVGTGAASGSTTNVNIGSVEGGTTTINSGTVVGAATTQNVFNATATTVNAFGAATTIEIGSTANTSVTNINGTTANTLGTLDGALVVDGGASVAGNTTIGGDLAVEGGDIVADPGNLGNTAQLFNTSTGTVNVANAAVTVDEYSAATSLDIGYNGTASSTTNIAVGAAATGNTKEVNIGTGAGTGTTNINIGTGGATNSTTNVTIGSTTDQDSTTVTINGNLTILGTQTTTNINTTNTNVQDALLALNSGMASNANNTNDIGLFIERGSTERNAFVGYDESADFFVTAYVSSAKTTAGAVTFSSANVGADATATPLDFLPIQIGALRISDATSRRGDSLIAAGDSVDDVVIGHLTAAAANTEFSVTDATAGRHLYNVVIDGGSF